MNHNICSIFVLFISFIVISTGSFAQAADISKNMQAIVHRVSQLERAVDGISSSDAKEFRDIKKELEEIKAWIKNTGEFYTAVGSAIKKLDSRLTVIEEGVRKSNQEKKLNENVEQISETTRQSLLRTKPASPVRGTLGDSVASQKSKKSYRTLPNQAKIRTGRENASRRYNYSRYQQLPSVDRDVISFQVYSAGKMTSIRYYTTRRISARHVRLPDYVVRGLRNYRIVRSKVLTPASQEKGQRDIDQ